MEYTFHLYNKLTVDGTTIALQNLLKRDYERKMNRAGMRSTQNLPVLGQPPVIVCIGSDLAIGDSLGPVTGSLLKHKTQGLNAYVYGTNSNVPPADFPKGRGGAHGVDEAASVDRLIRMMRIYARALLSLEDLF